MKLRQNLLCTALTASLAVSLYTATALAAGNVKLQFNSNPQAIALSQVAPDTTNGINFFPNSADRYLRMRLADPLLCAEFPSVTNTHVRFRLIDANGDVVTNNNSSGVANSFGSLSAVSGNAGGIRYMTNGSGEQRLILNTSADLICYTYSTFVSPNANVTETAKAGSSAKAGVSEMAAQVDPGLSYSLLPVTGNVAAKGVPLDQLFADGFESPFSGPVDVVTTLNAPATVRADQVYQYTINVRNAGGVAVSGVVVRDFFYKSTSTSNLEAVVFQNGNWSCSAGSGGNCGSTTTGTGVIFTSSVSLQPGGEVNFIVNRPIVITAQGPDPGAQFSIAAAAFTNPTAGETVLSNNSVVANGTIVDTQPPGVTGLPTTTQTFLEDGAAGPFNFTLSDPNPGGNVNLVTVTATSSNTSIIANTGLVVSGSGASRSLAVTPVANANGNVIVTLTATSAGGSTTRTIPFSITAVNDAPSFTFRSNCSATNGGSWNAAGSPAEFLYSAGSQNTQTCASFIVATMGPPNESSQQLELIEIVSNSNQAIFVEQPTLDLKNFLVFRPNGNSGTADLGIRIRDNGGTANGGQNTSAIQTLRVRVQGAIPTMSSIPTQNILEDGSTGAIAFTVADADTAPNLLVVTASSSNTALVPNASVVLGGSGANRTVAITPLADQFGTTQITLTVSDGAQQSQQTFTVNVASVNDAPSFSNLGNQLLSSGINSGLRTVNGWAHNISVGPANESNQQIAGFFVEVLEQSPANFLSGQSQVFNNGNLVYGLANGGGGVAFNGHACLRITLFDDGDGTPPNVNASTPAVLKIQVGPGEVDCNEARGAKAAAPASLR